MNEGSNRGSSFEEKTARLAGDLGHLQRRLYRAAGDANHFSGCLIKAFIFFLIWYFFIH